MEPYLLKMKEDYDQLLFVSDDLYRSLSLHLEFKKAKKGVVLKRAGDIEKCSRYLCNGLVGTYKVMDGALSLKNIYQKTDAVFDAESYTFGIKTTLEIKAISDVTYFEFPKIKEMLVVESFPDFAKLGIEINHRIQQRKDKQNEILRLGLRQGYALFCKLIPEAQNFLHNQDWAQLFNSSERTVSRVLNELNRPGI